MKFSLIVLSLLVTISLSAINELPSKEVDVEFVILIPSYKNEKWAVDNLRSACHQESSRPYEIFCVNDASPDRTGELMEHYVRDHHLESKVTIIHNEVNLGALANIYNTIHSYIADHKVVVLLDGDDMLAHNQVLLCLEKYYRNPDVWMTYGSTIRSDTGESLMLAHQIPDSILEQKKLRQHPFTATHLRTFKAGLFKKIKKEDLLFNGTFASAAWDLAIMFPMLEMAYSADPIKKIRSRYIPDFLYIYRVDNPISDHVVRLGLQKQIDEHIRSMPPYDSLDTLEIIS